jgi:class 3 adenylate cyclase
VSNKYTNYNSSALNKYIEKYFFTNILNQYPVIQIEFFNQIIYQNKSMDLDLKNYMKRDICYIFDKKHPSVVIIISRRNISKMISVIYLCRLFYIVTAISLLCYLINSNIYYLIFRPLENIGKVIDIISKDPVGSESITKLKKSIQNSKNQKKEDKGTVGYEIKIIQSAIIRISTLMAIGFGEAGGEILKRNISSSEGLNPMLSGKKINAIFGFCFIHNFSEINEAFQEKTMIFVNQISDIVHSCVDKFKGITNKNLGDCYLLAWKFKEKNKQNTNNTNVNNVNNTNINNTNENQNSNLQSLNHSNITEKINFQLADCALLSFLNIIKKINKCQNILAYRKDIDLIKKFGVKYTVQMGFGLHTGWGIEGAIGSYYKIDCSYLSPNVNIAARLETATNIYGVDILFSGEFYDLLSDFMKRKCRKIDIVTLKGSEKPICLYTVDVNKNIYPGKIVSKKDRMTLRERRSYYDLKKKKLWNKFIKFNYKYTIGEIYLKQSKGLRQLLKKNKSDMFYQYFEDGFGDYINGDWKDAALNLEKARYLDKSDGPTRTILDYIKSLNLTPPNNWDGYRVLTSKT